MSVLSYKEFWIEFAHTANYEIYTTWPTLTENQCKRHRLWANSAVFFKLAVFYDSLNDKQWLIGKHSLMLDHRLPYFTMKICMGSASCVQRLAVFTQIWDFWMKLIYPLKRRALSFHTSYDINDTVILSSIPKEAKFIITQSFTQPAIMATVCYFFPEKYFKIGTKVLSQGGAAWLEVPLVLRHRN